MQTTKTRLPTPSKNQNKTQPNSASVNGFIGGLPQPRKQSDAHTLLELFQRVSSQPAVMWGDTIIGFGSYHYQYDSGRQGDAPRTGFSPRKAHIVIYITLGFSQQQPLLAALGKHKTSVSCLYINKLADIDLAVLEQIIQADWDLMNEKYPN